MMAGNHAAAAHETETRHPLDAASLTAIASAVALIVTAFVTGLWQWMSGRRKTDVDAQAAMVNGFVALLAELKSERTQLISRINNLEEENHRQDRHVARLIRIMMQHNIEITDEDAS